MKQLLVSIALLYLGLAAQAGIPEVKIFTPGIPVVTGREYDVVTEICIVSDGTDTLDRIDCSVADLDPVTLRSARVVYTGTMSAIRSRTTSYVLKDLGKRLGGGQMLCAGEGFGKVLHVGHPTGHSFRIPVG